MRPDGASTGAMGALPHGDAHPGPRAAQAQPPTEPGPRTAAPGMAARPPLPWP